jgi:hypothetical protein
MATTFAVPDGRVAMAATTYTGTGANQSISNAVNTVSFQPDFVWGKNRTSADNHAAYDSVRGVQKRIQPNSTVAEDTSALYLTAFNSNGFSLGTDGQLNNSGSSFVAWQWKAGGTAVSNTAGTITSSVSANTTAGFSVVTYTGTGANATVGHGLGVAPSMVIVKNRLQAYNWTVYHIGLGGATNILNLNSTSASVASAVQFNGTNPTLSVFSVGAGGVANNNTNTTSDTFVAYCWAPVAGYSAFGSYTGNSSADGPFIYTGFRPRWLMIKNITVAGQWMIWDSSRDTYNPEAARLDAQDSAAEVSVSIGDFVSNGIKIRQTGTSYNATGSTYIYAAFAENPLKFSNAR